MCGEGGRAARGHSGGARRVIGHCTTPLQWACSQSVPRGRVYLIIETLGIRGIKRVVKSPFGYLENHVSIYCFHQTSFCYSTSLIARDDRYALHTECIVVILQPGSLGTRTHILRTHKQVSDILGKRKSTMVLVFPTGDGRVREDSADQKYCCSAYPSFLHPDFRWRCSLLLTSKISSPIALCSTQNSRVTNSTHCLRTTSSVDMVCSTNRARRARPHLV